MNDDVKQFRWREAMVILRETSKALKEYNPALEITCCVHATLNTYYVTELRGYDNWDLVASCPYFDVFSTTIISWDLPEKFFCRRHRTHGAHGKKIQQAVGTLDYGL